MVRIVDGSQAERDSIMQDLLAQNISTRRAIMAIHREAPYRSSRWESSLPNTTCATDTGFILPLFHDMTEAEQGRVIEAIQRIRR
jgi:dTDP-4-amino-4,6-dideoxygalactose transaminase